MAVHETVTPSGISITFEDGEKGEDGKGKRRAYWVNGEKHPSITTITGQFEKPGLTWAAEKLTVEGCLNLAADGELPNFTPAALSALKARGLRFDQVWRSKADRGTLSHGDLLAFALGEEPSDLDAALPAERGFLRGVAAFQVDHEPVAVHSEFMVGSPTFGFAGRPDFLGELPKLREGVGLLELKTTEEIPRYASGLAKPPYTEAILQIGGQSKGCVESGYPVPEWAAVLRVEASGEYVLQEVPISHSGFLRALAVYNVNRELAAQAKAMVKEAAKA